MKSAFLKKYLSAPFKAAICLIAIALSANSFAQEKRDNPLGLFKSLIGEWSIEDYSLTKEGKWQSAGGADWNFYSVLNGAAIQDDWIAPALDKPAPESGRQFGTNIRIYNPKTQEWEMAWMANTGKKVDTFKAKEFKDKIVMHGDYQGNPTRITFFNISKNQFSWTMEVDASRQKNSPKWNTVYKIEGTRKVKK